MTAKANTPEELESIMNSETNQDGLKYKYNEAKMEIKEQKKDPYASFEEKSKDENKVAKMTKKEMKKKWNCNLNMKRKKKIKLFIKLYFQI